VTEFLVAHATELAASGRLTRLPEAALRRVLLSDHLVLRTARGNVVPGVHREFHVLAIAFRWLEANPSTTTLTSLLACIRYLVVTW